MSTFDLFTKRNGETYLYNPYIEDYFPTRDVTKEFAKITKTAVRNYEFEKAFLLSRLSLAEKKQKAGQPQSQEFVNEISGMLSKYGMCGDIAAENALTESKSITLRGDNTFLVGFESDFNVDFDTGTVLIYKILCPTRVGGDVTDTLYLTSTNRATYGVEALIHYQNSQTDLYFMVWDWAPGLPYPVQVYMPYSELGDYIAQDTIRGIDQQFIQVQSQTIRGSADNWKNIVVLWNYRLQAYDIVHNYTYSALDSEQKNGTHWWGPFVETFEQDDFHGTNIVGFDQTLFASRDNSNVWSTPQLLSDTQSWLWGAPDRGFELVYFYPNHSFIVTTLPMGFTPGIRGSITAGSFTLGLARGLIYQMGNLKYIYIHLVVNSISGSPSGNLQIINCPLLPVYGTPLTLGITSFMGMNLSDRYVTPIILDNGSIELLSCGSGPESAVNINQLYQYATVQVAGAFLSNN